MYIIFQKGFCQKYGDLLKIFKISCYILQVVLKIVKNENHSEIFNKFAVRK